MLFATGVYELAIAIEGDGGRLKKSFKVHFINSTTLMVFLVLNLVGFAGAVWI